jgi:hypothetical protein
MELIVNRVAGKGHASCYPCGREARVGQFKVAIVKRGQEGPWREYWISSGSKGGADEAPSGLGRTEVVEAATVNEAINAVQRRHPDCTVMLAGGEHHID